MDLQHDDALGRNGGISARTALHVHRVLHAALRRAVRLQMLPRNPCESVEAPKPKRAQTGALDEAGVTRMSQSLRESSDSTLYVTVLLAVYTGEQVPLPFVRFGWPNPCREPSHLRGGG